MRKLKIISSLLFIFCSSFAQNVLTNDTIIDKSKLVVLPDSLKAEEEGDIYDLMIDEDLVPMDHPYSKQDTLVADSLKKDSAKLVKTMSFQDSLLMSLPTKMDVAMPILQKEDSLYSDSLHIDSLVSASLHADSIVLDSLVLDSVVLDNMAIDSTYEVRRRKFVQDSLRQDSIRLKKEADRYARKNMLSILEFKRIRDNFRRDYEAALERWDDYYLTMDQVRMKPEYYKYVVPLTYYSSSIRQAGSIEGWEPEDWFTREKKAEEARLYAGFPDLRVSKPMIEEVDRQLLSFYVNYPELVLHNETEYAGLSLLSDNEMVAGPREENILEKAQSPYNVEGVSESDLLVLKPNFWTTGGSGYLQFSQNHISDNWYKGGESTNSLLSGLVLFANYDDKQRIQFENKLEWKLGFITAPSDTIHSYKANNDMIRLNSKLGLRAIKHWYYTLSVDFKTQFFSNYKTNTDDLISAFFSPAELNVGLGMDYKYVKEGVCNLSVLLNPLNYTLYTVASDKVDPTKFNIKEGHKHENVIGSRVDATLKWKIFKALIWESHFSYTTNYEKALADWENTFTFVVNKYLSTKLFVHGRFDDGTARKEGQNYFQLQEILSFGLNYTW